MVEWTIERVQNLIQSPNRVLREEPWKSWIHAHGGLQEVYQKLRGLPLTESQRKVLEIILANPSASVDTYTNALGMHFTTYHRHQRALFNTVMDFLNHGGIAA
ncbi:MAG TPA: hypothetical protein VGE07_10155, partial [Herpetosiphonaceae bacterium]